MAGDSLIEVYGGTALSMKRFTETRTRTMVITIVQRGILILSLENGQRGGITIDDKKNTKGAEKPSWYTEYVNVCNPNL